MNRLRFALLVSTAVASFGMACGGISDPTRGSERVATVSGALTGTAVPANARVALVWRKTAGGVEVGEDVPVVGGRFTMNLAAPAAHYFGPIDGDEIEPGYSTPPSVGGGTATPEPLPAGGSSGGTSSSGGGGKPAFGSFGPRLAPRDFVSGGFNEPLSAAIAGFVVYADANGNGKLDLEGQYASSPDQILGGNTELILAYLRDGGALDYEKLRDKSGILPAAGFNLAWREGRWLPLNVVELELGKKSLPSSVCSSGYGYGGSSSGSSGVSFDDAPQTEPSLPPPSSGSGGSSGSSSSSGSSGTSGGYYPSPGDPNVSCSPDGRSYSYSTPSNCPPYEPPPPGLCSNSYGTVSACAGSTGGINSLPDGAAVPAGWPCPVAEPLDGGPAPDAGPADAGAGG